MAKTPDRSGKQWTPKEVKQLRQEGKGNTPTRVIALHLERTEAGVRSKAATKRSPCDRSTRAPTTGERASSTGSSLKTDGILLIGTVSTPHCSTPLRVSGQISCRLSLTSGCVKARPAPEAPR